jgi:hypothetical protein
MQLLDAFHLPRHFALVQKFLIIPTSADPVHRGTGVEMHVPRPEQLRQRRPLVARRVHPHGGVIVARHGEMGPEMQRDLQPGSKGDPHSIGASVSRGWGRCGFAPGTEDQRQRRAPQRMPGSGRYKQSRCRTPGWQTPYHCRVSP